MGYIVFPITPPITFGEKSNGVTFPITFPLTFSSSEGKVTFPITFPMTFESGSQRKTTSLPIKETCQYANESKQTQLPIKEVAITTEARLPVKEVAWVFTGFVIEETIIENLTQKVTLIEDIRSRILTELMLLNGSDINVRWYGDSVPMVEIHKKMSSDEEFVLDGTYTWEQGSAVVKVGNGDYDIKVMGENQTGESKVVTLGETVFTEIDVEVELPINEKTYGVDIEYVSKYRVEVNY